MAELGRGDGEDETNLWCIGNGAKDWKQTGEQGRLDQEKVPKSQGFIHQRLHSREAFLPPHLPQSKKESPPKKTKKKTSISVFEGRHLRISPKDGESNLATAAQSRAAMHLAPPPDPSDRETLLLTRCRLPRPAAQSVFISPQHKFRAFPACSAEKPEPKWGT